jgi:hypothetical protein
MDPHRLSCPAAADAADTEDWGKIRAQSSRSFDFFCISMLLFEK